MITTLREEDLRVLEDGVPQKLFTFQRETDRPLSIALLIDVSASEERMLPYEKAAARSFVETIIRSSKDQVAIIPFTDYAYLEQGLTPNVLAIYKALERLEVALPSYVGTGRKISGISSGPGTIANPREGSTAIWDAVTVSAGEILTRSLGQRRRAIILLTDGQDTSSRVTRRAAIDKALEAETVIYAIGIGDSRYEDRQRRAHNLPSTGGRAFSKKKSGLTRASRRRKELRSPYLRLTIYNKTRDAISVNAHEIVNRTCAKSLILIRPATCQRSIRVASSGPEL